MNKCFYALSMFVGLCLTSSACSSGSSTAVDIDTDESDKTSEPDTIASDSASNAHRYLVVYFSCTNTTKGVAEQIADIVGCDTYRIEPKEAYTSDDLDYNNSSSRANREQNDPTSRPEIANAPESLADYDGIFLGYPIWWGNAPRIISTFLESYDFSGKTIIPFCTSHSSGIGSSDDNLHSLAPQASWAEGRRFSGSTSAEDIAEWIESLGIDFSSNASASVGSFNLGAGTNGNAPVIRLNSGYDMPIIGLGTYSLLGDVCVSSVKSALQQGFRKIDTAYMYHNEESVGEGIRQSGVPREEVFVCTKLYPNQYDDAENAIDMALEKLGLEYIDLMLLHHPGTNDVEAYKAMERAVAEGKIRSLGVSNYYVDEMTEFLPQVTIKPALVQNEIHPYYQENDVIPYMHEQGIAVEAWYPLGGRGYTSKLLNNPVISAIAEAHGKSSAQVILRWDLQKGVVVIPGSSNPDHMKENISLFDFELTDEEMERINALDRNEKHDWY
ncbi:MAG: flavodoxin [Prevotellaceae bacterium]|nr:flavodoxin [Prevotellaceae bacterium]